MRLGPLIAVGAVLALLMMRRASAATVPQDWTMNPPPGEELFSTGGSYDEVPIEYGYDIAAETENPFMQYITGMQPGSASSSKVEALLYAIRTAEVGRVPDEERYYYGYGYKRFSGTSDHPVATGELQPSRLPDAMCRAAGRSPGCVSTAAGAYQFILPTWRNLRNAGSPLPDYSPASQDEAARRLLKQIGAISALNRDDIEGAIRLAGKQWASLPGSTAQQNPVAMSRALNLYRDGLAMTSGDTMVG